MRDHVTMAIARILGVSSNVIGDWEITTRSTTGGIGRIGFTTGIRSALKVSVALERLSMDRLRKLGGSVQLAESRAVQYDCMGEQRPGPLITQADLVLLYGKETQHIFKALHQQMTVRGCKPKRKKA